MEITNGWQEVTLSVLATWTTLQNTTTKKILILEQETFPVDSDNSKAFEVDPGDVWTCVHDTRRLYVNGLYIESGKVEEIAVS